MMHCYILEDLNPHVCVCLMDSFLSRDAGGSYWRDYEDVMLYRSTRHFTLEDFIILCHPYYEFLFGCNGPPHLSPRGLS
jgi:hypothetical protein